MAVLISSVQHKQRADAVVIFPQPLSAAELAPHNSAEITSAEFQARDFFTHMHGQMFVCTNFEDKSCKIQWNRFKYNKCIKQSNTTNLFLAKSILKLGNTFNKNVLNI